MNILEKPDVIQEGDLVMLYMNVNSIFPLEVVPKIRNRNGLLVDNHFQTFYGVLRVYELIGKTYGSKINLPKGWGHLLRPTCELWTKTLPHRTQIIYTPDISLLIYGLDLAPGSTCIEAGTGSGSLSHAIIRTVLPNGHLYTFDFHEQRADVAREEFHKHGLSSWVTVKHRDVIADGFGEIGHKVDAISLDLPAPWEVVPHVIKALKKGGKLATFSPCIEQVQKTTEALKLCDSFIMIRSQEVLQRELLVQNKTMNSISFEHSGKSDENAGKIDENSGKMQPITKEMVKFKSLSPPYVMPGHTGYITFATFIPKKIY